MENLPAKVPHTLLADLGELFIPIDKPEDVVLELVISTVDHDINTRELAAYLALVDRVYGRTTPEGLRSYSRREGERLRVTEIRTGSLEFIFQVAYEHKQVTSFVILLLFLRSLPNVFKLSAEGIRAVFS